VLLLVLLLVALQNGVTSPVAVDKPRKRLPGIEDLTHPLLGDAPTLKLLPDPSKVTNLQPSPSAQIPTQACMMLVLGARSGYLVLT
jgi:hypothetical protein